MDNKKKNLLNKKFQTQMNLLKIPEKVQKAKIYLEIHLVQKNKAKKNQFQVKDQNQILKKKKEVKEISRLYMYAI